MGERQQAAKTPRHRHRWLAVRVGREGFVMRRGLMVFSWRCACGAGRQQLWWQRRRGWEAVELREVAA